MEVWGGIECSINRVGKDYFDQMEYDNLYLRPEILDQILDLGIKTLRFPILWEKVWPDNTKAPDWAVKEHLELLKTNKIAVIAGLVHHGSGPSYAQIHHDGFAEKLAVYARMVAEKFPWINDYTPINEPLTTARFCGLYGLWHPHATDDKTFLKILINECRATVLAMKAIREVNPMARLVLTEDLTKIQGTNKLKIQTTFENNRRWLSIDLLCGKVNKRHPLWDYLMAHHIGEDQLHFFIENPMPPNVLGFNYYITSERYLDDKLCNHPPSTHGGNGQLVYSDVETVRHPNGILIGLANLMREAWQRYKLPMSVTEAHLCCGREDQLRWLKLIWDDCSGLCKEGINVTAVTFWSLFGAYGWDKLLTRRKGNYESGAFDLSSGDARPTAIAKFIACLAKGQAYQSPVIDGPGWWQRHPKQGMDFPPILIIGGSGTLGAAFVRICAERRLPCIAPERKKLDLSDQEQINSALSKYRPYAIINAAGYVDVDAAQQEVATCLLANTVGPVYLAKACRAQNIQLLSFSSDLVFNGNKVETYSETDPIKPLNIYGHSKAEAERHILNHHPDALIVRTSTLFGPWDRFNFVTTVLNNLNEGKPLHAINDATITATYIPHLVHASLNLLLDEENGIWHLTNKGVTSWYNLAKNVAQRAGYDPVNIQPVSQQAAKLSAERPANSALQSTRGNCLPPLDSGLDEYFGQL